MFCINCGKQLNDGSKFCSSCGNDLRDVQDDSLPENAEAISHSHDAIEAHTNQHKTIRRAISVTIIVVVCALAFLLYIGPKFFGVQFLQIDPFDLISETEDVDKTTNESSEIHVIEGEGFDSAEDAVSAYLTALQNADVESMINTFAVETYADNYDFEAMVSRTKMYALTFDKSLPATSDFAKDINLYQRVDEIVLGIKLQFINLVMADSEELDRKPILDGQAIMFESDSDIDAFVALLGDPAHIESLRTLEIVNFIAPAYLSEHYTSEVNQENIEELTSICGADEGESVVAHVDIDGQPYFMCFDTIRYGDKWYLKSLGGNIGALLGVSAYSGGVTYPR